MARSPVAARVWCVWFVWFGAGARAGVVAWVALVVVLVIGLLGHLEPAGHAQVRPARAAAAPVEAICPRADAGVIVVDGLLDEWKGVRGIRRQAAPGDAGLELLCNHDETTLYLLVHALDDRLARTARASATEDHVVLELGGATLTVFPGSSVVGAAHVLRWKGNGSPGAIELGDGSQRDGWAIELAIPLASLPAWEARPPFLEVRARFHDADSGTAGRIETVVDTGDARLVFADAAALFDDFLAAFRLRRAQLTLDSLAELDGKPGLERVVAGGAVLGVLSDEYRSLELPVARPEDVLEVRVVDLAGEGKSSLLVRTRERFTNGTRDVLSVWNLAAGTFRRTFAQELEREIGGMRVTCTWELVPRKKGKRGKPAGMELVVRPGTAIGFTAENFDPGTDEEVRPVLTPWAGKVDERWSFTRDQVMGG